MSQSSSSGRRPAELPPQLATISAAQLGKILGKATATIYADLSRRPKMLPPSIRIGKKSLWLESTVLAWLHENEHSIMGPRAPAGAGARKRGRPTKVEAAEAAVAGLSVRALRSQRAAA